VPAKAGTYIPEAVVMGPRFRGGDNNELRSQSSLAPLALMGPAQRAISLTTNLARYSRPALCRRAGHAHALESLAHGRRFYCIVDGLGEAPHDLLRRSLGKRERTPAAAVEAGKAQLLRGGEPFEAGRTLEPERGDGLDRAALNLRQRGRNLLGD